MASQHGTIIELGDRESGFIKKEKGTDEKLFFHSDHLKDVKFGTLKVGDKLSFTIRETRNGPYAIDVTKVTLKVVKVAKPKAPTKVKAKAVK